MNHTLKSISLVGGPLLAILLAIICHVNSLDSAITMTASITLWCAIWWIFEPIPIPVTSLLPLALFPLLGVLEPKLIAQSYGSPLILLLMGGFILSTAMARSGAHRRIALSMVNLLGTDSGKKLVMGFMLASASLSMWISNTATTLMLLPVALAVLEQAKDKRLAVPLLLGIAFAANLGGIGTPIGTPPNLIFMKIYAENTGSEPGFLQWMIWTIPIIILFLPIMGMWLTRNISGAQHIQIPQAGIWRAEEKRVLMVFALTALAWMTRKEPFGGWSDWFSLPYANDASVALLAVVVLFIIPNGKGDRLLDWSTAVRIPWGVLILFGGGIAIAKAFVASGLSLMIGDYLSNLATAPTILLIAGVCLVVTFLTEITSNTATTSLLMPILAAAGIAANIDPAILMVPAALSASCAFMLPVATAPNAIVFGTDKIAVTQMIREGLVLNFIGAGVIAVVCWWYLG